MIINMNVFIVMCNLITMHNSKRNIYPHLNIIKPYTTIHIPFISGKLRVREIEVENLMVSLILDSRIQAQIDQTRQLVELTAELGCYAKSEFQGARSWTTSTKERLKAFV